MEEVPEGAELVSKQAVAVRPDSPDVAGPTRTKVWVCRLCEDKKFRSAGLASRHFNKEHDDLKEAGDTWKDHYEVVES